MNCIKDGKLTNNTCFGCEINQRECDMCELLNRPRAKRVKLLKDHTVVCPSCNEKFGDKDSYLYGNYLKYCDNCGQALNWEAEEMCEYCDTAEHEEHGVMGAEPFSEDETFRVIQRVSDIERKRIIYVLFELFDRRSDELVTAGELLLIKKEMQDLMTEAVDLSKAFQGILEIRYKEFLSRNNLES